MVPEAMAGFCVSARLVRDVCPGEMLPTARVCVLGARPKLFLLNWIMKPSSGCCVPLLKASWYTARQRGRLSVPHHLTALAAEHLLKWYVVRGSSSDRDQAVGVVPECCLTAVLASSRHL